jgi:hypothetical protein
MMRHFSFALLLGVVIGCSNGCSNGTSSDTDGGDPLTADERAGFDAGAPSTPAAIQLAAVTDKMFKFDPTIDPTKTAAENAQNVVNEAQQNLGTDGDGGTKCGSVTLNGTTVTANFGSGCMFGNIAVAGTITVGVTKNGSSISLAVAFMGVTVNGEPLSGTATFTTSNGTTFTLTANITWQKTTYTAQSFTVTGAPGQITLDGALGLGDAVSSYTFAGVVWKQGDCYPSAGTLTIKKGLLTETVTFTAATATTGVVSVTIGKKMVMGKLPAYGSCGK